MHASLWTDGTCSSPRLSSSGYVELIFVCVEAVLGSCLLCVYFTQRIRKLSFINLTRSNRLLEGFQNQLYKFDVALESFADCCDSAFYIL
jgi:hypothetical protein